MATLDPQTRNRLIESLRACELPWALCGLIEGDDPCAKLDSIAGLIDWMLHGQVSRLFHASSAPLDGCSLFPGDPVLGRPSFLFFQLTPKASASALAKQVKKLSIPAVALAETTFPEDFLAKLKQNLEKDGIRWQRLEPIP